MVGRRLLRRVVAGRPSSARDLRDVQRAHAAADPVLARVAFDADRYLARYADVRVAGVDPLEHYVRSGAAEGRSPSTLFDPRIHRAEVGGLDPSPVAPLLHLLRNGPSEHRTTNPFLDVAWYRATYDDLGATHPVLHLATVGLADGRDPHPAIDLAWYRASHPDVDRSGLPAFEHFVTIGHGLGWYPHPVWCEGEYLRANAVAREHIALGTCRSGFAHFCWLGARDVVAGIGYLPVRSGSDGSLAEFAAPAYREANPDVVGDPAAVLHHFLRLGHRDVAAGRRRLVVNRPATGRVVLGPSDTTAHRSMLALVAHYDPDGVLAPHLVGMLRTFDAEGIDVCLVGLGLTPGALDSVRDLVRWVVVKDDNERYRDFGSWMLAAEVLGDAELDHYDRVLLVNDSVVFPVRDPAAVLAAMRSSPADLWGITDAAIGGRHHVQSYFVALSARAVRPVLRGLRARVAAGRVASKLGLIEEMELGLTEEVDVAGLTREVFAPIASLAPFVGPGRTAVSGPAVFGANPTHSAWRRLLERGAAILKVDLLRDNPVPVDLTGWEVAVDPAFADVDAIRAYLERYRAAVRRSGSAPPSEG